MSYTMAVFHCLGNPDMDDGVVGDGEVGAVWVKLDG